MIIQCAATSMGHRRTWGLADDVGIAGHAREAVAALARDHLIALYIVIDDSRGLRNVIRPGGQAGL